MALPVVGRRQAVEGESLTLIRDGGELVWVPRKDFRSYPPYAPFFNRLRQAWTDVRNILFGEINYHVDIPVGAELLLDVWSGSEVEPCSDGPTMRVLYNGNSINLLHKNGAVFVPGFEYTLEELGELTGVTVLELPCEEGTQPVPYADLVEA